MTPTDVEQYERVGEAVVDEGLISTFSLPPYPIIQATTRMATLHPHLTRLC
jgi:hypothetical protein